jgi:hypothetical protein
MEELYRRFPSCKVCYPSLIIPGVSKMKLRAQSLPAPTFDTSLPPFTAWSESNQPTPPTTPAPRPSPPPGPGPRRNGFKGTELDAGGQDADRRLDLLGQKTSPYPFFKTASGGSGSGSDGGIYLIKGGAGNPPPTPNPPAQPSKELTEILMYVQDIHHSQGYLEKELSEQRHNLLSLEKKTMNNLHELKLAVQAVESKLKLLTNPPMNPEADWIPDSKPQGPFRQVEGESLASGPEACLKVPWLGLEEPKWDFSKLIEAGTDEPEVEDDFEGITSSEMRPRPGKPDHNPPPPKPDRQPKPKPKPRPNPKPQR